MFDIHYQQGRKRRTRYTVKGDRCVIGSARHSDLVFRHRHIAKRHATLYVQNDQIHIEDLGSITGTWVNRERVITYGPLTDNDEITIGDVVLRIVFEPSKAKAKVTEHAGEDVHHMLQQTSEPTHADGSENVLIDEQSKLILYWTRIIHEHLISEMDLRRKDVHSMSDEQLRVEAETLIDQIIGRISSDLPPDIDVTKLRNSVINEAVGLGPLERFLEDDSITEIMVNNHQEVFVERAGKLINSGENFSSDQAVMSVIERIITPLGRRIDEGSPMVDARLKDGSRVNAIIPPLAIKGPSLTIRKFAKRRLSFNDIIKYGSMNQEMVDFLRVCVEQRKNIIVSGGTGSGKTTLLNVLSSFIPDSERIVTVEDAAELKLYQPNLVSLEAKPANIEGRGAVTIRELVKNTLRMRPDRIIVGECRGGEALDMLQAMNTGHDGSLTTAHANSPRDALSRLEVMVLMAGMDLPVSAIREQMASAVNIIVQQTRYACGSRKISKITEVTGIEGSTIQLQDIFEFRQRGFNEQGKVDGEFNATGFIPSFYESLKLIGVPVDLSIFTNEKVEHR
ncbi:MAG: Flp pilus assembly complex ATPase component TadA [Candidatus Thiodiazotropha sp. (ex Ctena orbiculata)]|uniref:Flp pilus assembly complex ATPase component TadA n=1 Tax=Candidatus Thiodiazotropha taylori TaxID=2792791 RepID=A0A944MFF8_9GAMM|nr:Flp pilus assembly complex ATPase component TadA [Candidatus Thiodiazotropha taylori]MBT3029324.1 Flp pilus assembly complex ATPase component TadA [Candidatus Thiodiazotropha taylori]MBT3037048.1 Flp pilus assembly complex ATPase component TadA [Candidatus Thiodiazotropha taylori]MBV2136998.1 Flp pilus assembly complex ATPase component TadA [Candidatus Thiodiazotropha taylori]